LSAVQESIDKLKRWVGDGPMVGLKLGGYSGICNKPEFDPVFRQAVELKAVIYQHTWIKLGGDPLHPGGGNFPRESMPEQLVEVAARYPDYPMICGHTGGDWELGIRAVRASRNLSVGTGGGYPTRGMIEMAVRELGAERVIYGSDVTGRSFASQLGKVHGAAISEKQKTLIFSENLHRLMRPILEMKGIKIE
jgi:predicted TIM-barrel fold metal-dependent hydrolase